MSVRILSRNGFVQNCVEFVVGAGTLPRKVGSSSMNLPNVLNFIFKVGDQRNHTKLILSLIFLEDVISVGFSSGCGSESCVDCRWTESLRL